MSELREVLTQPQRIKHHELLQFLSSHPNVEYSIAQLDYLLPRGAALWRFPEEWFVLMAKGECSNRNIELIIRDEESKSEPSSSRSFFSRPQPDRTFLICRRPELRSLKELQDLINTPAMMPDPEECVGLHTDQIILSRNLLRDCQRYGIAFYFSDKFAKKEVISGGDVDPDGGVSSPTTARVEALFSQQLPLSEISGVATAVVPLPRGLRIRHKLFTSRGVAVGDAHCLPIRLQVQERLLVTFDNENAVLRQVPGGKDGLQVQWRVVVPGGSGNAGMSPTTALSGSVEPLSIRSRSVSFEKKLPAAPLTTTETLGKEGNIYSFGGGQTIRYTKVQLDIEALSAVFPLKLIFMVNGQECIVNMEVVDVDATFPGILIGREREPSSFTLPPAYHLMDPLVMGHGVTSARSDVVNAPQTCTNTTKLNGDGEPQGTINTNASFSSPTKAIDRGFNSVIPWWQNSSPLVLKVRDATYPTEEAVSTATEIVYAKRALLHEAQLRAVRHSMREKIEGGGEGTSGRRDRRRVRHRQDLRNRHMLHFGLDASVPFSNKEEGL
ncbi:unnamed protein product [Phytomonas sp. Hart1]|nr:unnamed protein product [Phytomonas sp. Hart1]|eukprot:CCW67213.1 unnamed protein product [Phytomonas sp. isolate Hart1]